MLTINDVVKLAEENVIIKFKRKSHNQYARGEYNPTDNEILIYPYQKTDGKNITLIYEMLRAKYCMNNKPYPSDEELEAQAKQTYIKNPKIIDLIDELI